MIKLTKKYIEYMDEISSDELYHGLLGGGLFNEKLPPIFTSESFYDYCTRNNFTNDQANQYIFHENMRNTNEPRPLGIPTPFSYNRLCRCLSENWDNIREHFRIYTSNHNHKISRIHIRKRVNRISLFRMNYKDWYSDGSPELDLIFNKRYLVKADISKCFPSIYSHSIPWALKGKEYAKNNRDRNLWFNKIDISCMNCKHGETHGLLIGPHASNLISEIILTVIDDELYRKGYMFIRNIDDYNCYTKTYEDGEKFLVDLRDELRNFDLLPNHKKSIIQKLPIAMVEQWVRKINSFVFEHYDNKITYSSLRSYFDHAIELMSENDYNSSIINYAIKVLSKKELTSNARNYLIKTMMHLVILYPYLAPLLDEHLFVPFSVEQTIIKEISGKLYQLGLETRNYEAICFALFFAIKYDFIIDNINVNDAINSSDCLFLLLLYKYSEKHNIASNLNQLDTEAHNLSTIDVNFDQNWLFVYEVLDDTRLNNKWKSMKQAGVSFIDINSLTT